MAYVKLHVCGPCLEATEFLFVCAVEQEGQYGEVCVFASCKYDLRKGDLLKLGQGVSGEYFFCGVYRW